VVDARTDVYGLGATLYHILTGHAPFTGGSHEESIRQVQYDFPTRPRCLRPEVPRELEAIVLKCLEKNPARRYPTAEALAKDLDRFLAGQAQEAPLLTWPRRVARRVRHKQRSIAVIAFAAVAVFVLGAIVRSPRPVTGSPANPDPPPLPPPGRPVIGLPPPRLTEAEVQAQLRDNRQVVLFDKTGPAVPLAWELGSCDIRQSENGDAGFSLHSMGEAVLRVLSDPGIDRYRLRALVRQDMVLRDVQPGASMSYSRVGLSIGHNRIPNGANGNVHVLITAGFFDTPVPVHRFALTDRAFIEQPLQPFNGRGVIAAETKVGAAPDGLREIVLDVTPEIIDAHGGGRTVRLRTHNIQTARTEHEKLELRSANGEPILLPPPSARLPLGIWVSGCWVSIKKVTISPLP
jgi:hypothetical protein